METKQSRPQPIRRLIFLCTLLTVLAGCAGGEVDPDKPAADLASEGMAAYEKENYKKAIRYFEKIRDWYPFSKYAKLAELKIADSHFYRKEYEEAIFAYEDFESLHPRNEAIPYVVFQIGLSYYQQIRTIDRDPSPAKKALEAFERLMRTFPEDLYSEKAEEYIRECRQHLARHEFYVGFFYYKSGHYKAALNRFKKVVERYPDVGEHRKALMYMAMCAKAIEKQTP